MTWHTGRTVGVTLYKGDGPADLVGVMVGPHDEACALAQQVVRAVNAHADLLDACEAFCAYWDEANPRVGLPGVLGLMRAAIAQARGAA